MSIGCEEIGLSGLFVGGDNDAFDVMDDQNSKLLWFV